MSPREFQVRCQKMFLSRQDSEALKSDCAGSELGLVVLITRAGCEGAAGTERSLWQQNGDSSLAEAFPELFVSLSAAERGNQPCGHFEVLSSKIP